MRFFNEDKFKPSKRDGKIASAIRKRHMARKNKSQKNKQYDILFKEERENYFNNPNDSSGGGGCIGFNNPNDSSGGGGCIGF